VTDTVRERLPALPSASNIAVKAGLEGFTRYMAQLLKSLSAGQPEDTKRTAKPSRAFLLKLQLRSQPQLLLVIRSAMEPLMEMLGFAAENGREIIRAVDESVSNIMRHSYHGRLDQLIELYCNRLERRIGAETEQGVEILLFDYGPAVDPTKLEARPLDEIRPGGLGLHIIRASMDSVEYKRAGRLNRLRLVKFTGSKKCCPELKDQGQ
jgi:serine/threonine-protein kinase RsbW